MKKLIIIFILGLFLLSCSTTKECSKKHTNQTEKNCCKHK